MLKLLLRIRTWAANTQMPSRMALNLRNTKLDTKSALKVLKSMAQKKITKIDMSYNPNIGAEFYKFLGETIEANNLQLKVLNFEGNKIGDATLQVLSQSLRNSTELKVLNLSKCEITDKGVPALVKILDNCINLKGCLLHYNRITGHSS
jgi:Ran GTPase-activating protein (RanGAP) involved in mRNA processing and transport